jgi:hypothetical protein
MNTSDIAEHRSDTQADTRLSRTARKSTCASERTFTPTIEGVFSLIKRGVMGTFHSVLIALAVLIWIVATPLQ